LVPGALKAPPVGTKLNGTAATREPTGTELADGIRILEAEIAELERQGAAELRSEFLEKLEAQQRADDKEFLTPHPFIGLKQFLAEADMEPEPTWLIPELVPGEGTVLLVSVPNVGKTWLILAIAKNAALLGRDVYIQEEEGTKKQLASRIRNLRIEEGAGVFSIALQSGQPLEDEEYLQLLADIARNSAAPVFVFDPLSGLFAGDENDAKEAKAICRRLTDLRRANPRCLLVLVHHSSKGSTRRDVSGPSVYAARGSSVFSGWCDVQLNLDEAPKESGAVQFGVEVAKMRMVEKCERQHFRIELGEGVVSICPAKKRSLESSDARILAALGRRKSPVSKNELHELVGGKRGLLLEAVDRLIEAGKIEHVARGQYQVVRQLRLESKP
jgi:KaiC/GvpD/RAD55 family RecA-like ATPase